MNNTKANVLFNVGLDKQKLDNVINLLVSFGYTGQNVRACAARQMDEGIPTSILAKQYGAYAKRIEYSATDWFDKEQEGAYANLPTIDETPIPKSWQIGCKRVTVAPDGKSLLVGHNEATVSRETVQEILSFNY
jgi:hypothetical protein